MNRMMKLARRPHGMVKPEDFRLEEGPMPEPGEGEVRIKIAYVSLD
ncbi:NADP-dependent oxidoreductase, partial [Acinetobacter baumannii]